MIILNFSYYLLISLQFPVFLGIQTIPDQTRARLDCIRLDLCPIRTLATFFEVKSISFVFINYILVHMRVSGICGNSKSFFVSHMKPYKSAANGLVSGRI